MKLKTFTINDIRAFKPCYNPNKHLSESWQGTAIDLLDIKEIPFQDRLWVLMRTDFVSEKLMRLFAVWCARQVQHLTNDERSINAIDTAERFANGNAAIEELRMARDAAGAAAGAATWYAAGAAARAAAWEAAGAAARAAAWEAARDAAWYAAWEAAWAAAWEAAWDAARDAQEIKLRDMILKGIETGDCVLEVEK